MKITSGASALLLVISLAPSLVAEPIRVTGRILGVGGSGLAEARVELFPAIESVADAAARLAGKPAPPLASARPGKDGSFEIVAPESGGYTVRVRAEGFVPEERPLVPLVEDQDLPPVRLEPALPFPLQAVGLDGRPLAGVTIRWAGFGNPLFWKTADGAGTTGTDGRVVLPGTRFDPALLAVTSPLYLGQPPIGVVAGAPPATFRLSSRGAVPIEARGLDGKPMPGALVRWRSWPVGVTGPDGRLTVVLPAGSEPLVIEARNGAQGRITAPGGPREGGAVVVRLEPPRVVAGKVVDAASKRPIPGALVWSGRPPAVSPVRTGPDGSFRLEIPGGGAGSSIEAAAPGYLAARPHSLSKAAGPVTLTLDPAAAISGIVVDSSGRPVAGVLVRPRPEARRSPAGSAQSSTRPDGRFRLTGLLPRGTYEIEASRKGIVRASTTARTPAPGQPSPEVRIVLPDGKTAFGRVEDEEGRPVAGAALTLRPEVRVDWSEPVPEPFEAVSDQAGRFEFRSLAPGPYGLRVERAGFSRVDKPGLEIARETEEADWGVITLPAGVVLEGQVTDTRGTPLAGAEVRARPSRLPLFNPRSPSARSEPDPTARTGPDGTFRFADLKRGETYDLEALHPGHVGVRAPGVVAPAPEPVRIELPAARRLSGRVVGPLKEPVRNALVLWWEQPHPRMVGGAMVGMTGGIRAEASSDAEGFFELGGLAPGPVDLQIQASGYTAKQMAAVPIPEDGDVEGLEIALDWSTALEVRALNGADEPVPGVSAIAWPEGQDPFRANSPPSCETGAQGLCRIEIPGPGRYQVSLITGGKRPAPTLVEAGPGATLVELRTTQAAEVSGRVAGEDGAGIANANVLLELAGPNRGLRRGAVSDADGSFVLPGVEAGSYRLWAEKQGFTDAGGPRPVEVAGQPVPGIEIRLTEEPVSGRGAIAGHLLGIAPEEAVRAEIWAVSEGEGDIRRVATGRASSDSAYRIEDLHPGLWRVNASTPAGHQARGTVRLDPGVPAAALDLDFSGFTLSGRVLVDGRPLAGAEIRLIARDRSAHTSTVTTSDGSFSLLSLRRGTYDLLLVPEGSIGDARTIEISGDRSLPIEIRTGKITGRIVSPATGAPVPDAVVEITGGNDRTSPFILPSARSGEDGAFESRRLAPGAYRLVIRKEGFAPAETTVTVSPGGTAAVEIPLTP